MGLLVTYMELLCAIVCPIEPLYCGPMDFTNGPMCSNYCQGVGESYHIKTDVDIGIDIDIDIDVELLWIGFTVGC